MWSKGTVEVPTGDGKYITLKYVVKHFEVPSIWGYDEGRASKISLQQNGKEVYNFDRGEDIPPQTEEAKIALEILLKQYN